MTTLIYIPGMGMYFITAFVLNYLEMIKARFLIGQDFLGFGIIKKLKASCQETLPPQKRQNDVIKDKIDLSLSLQHEGKVIFRDY